MKACRIIVHDYAGHPFQAQLSRSLAARGHEVLHLYSGSTLTPQGALKRTAQSPPSLEFEAIRLSATIDKQAHIRRAIQERVYGRLLYRRIVDFAPNIVVSANTPLEAQKLALAGSQAVGAKFIFWLQDLHGLAIKRLLRSRLGLLGWLVGTYYEMVERRILRGSDAIVAISEDFQHLLSAWGISDDAVHVIHNWASREELPLRPRENSWAHAHGLANRFCFMYAGTLGMKHNPELLLRLGMQYEGREDVAVMVVSEGPAAEWLNQHATRLRLNGLTVLPFQDYSVLPDVMASADVLLAILEKDAGLFSVPSKILSYLCAGRALLLAVPTENLAAAVIKHSAAGVVVDPSDVEAFLRAAENLRCSVQERKEMGLAALRYAETNFDLAQITERFEGVFQASLGAPVQ